MSYDEHRDDCEITIAEAGRLPYPPSCTCPPAAVTETIWIREEDCCRQNQCREYRAALLRIVDQLRAELAAKDAEIERLNAAPRGERVCEWTPIHDPYACNKTGCGHNTVTWLGGSINHKYCQYCAGKIQVKEQSHD